MLLKLASSCLCLQGSRKSSTECATNPSEKVEDVAFGPDDGSFSLQDVLA